MFLLAVFACYVEYQKCINHFKNHYNVHWKNIYSSLIYQITHMTNNLKNICFSTLISNSD